jgi:hypothetical protein
MKRWGLKQPGRKCSGRCGELNDEATALGELNSGAVVGQPRAGAATVVAGWQPRASWATEATSCELGNHEQYLMSYPGTLFLNRCPLVTENGH